MIDYLKLGQDNLLPVFAQNLVIEYGDGCWLTDIDGNRYLDFTSGIAVCNLGYNHPAITVAIQDQATKLLHVSNLFQNCYQPQLAAKLSSLSFNGKFFFANSGAEANEGVIKFARRYGTNIAPTRNKIVCINNAFHGRTMTTLAATGKDKYMQGFSPVPGGFCHCDADLESLRSTMDADVCAIMLEPIQGEGGIKVLSKEFLQGVRDICDQENILLIFDEIQCGIARTGKMFAYENFGVVPDVIALAKGLGNGVPIGAFGVRSDIADIFRVGDHGSTFGGNPLVTRVALEVLNTIESEAIIDNVNTRSSQLFATLNEMKQSSDIIVDVRGMGLMIGVEFTIPVGDIVKACRAAGLLVITAGEKVVRLLPPLIISEDEVKKAMTIFATVITEF